jgi:dTDP-4-amino-4,6-dideoxygalactose transaminase
MSEISAAMGLTSLEGFDAFAAANRRNHAAYAAALDGVPGIELVPYDGTERSNRQYVVLEIDGSAPLSRDELQEVLRAENILARRYFYPGCHRMEPYRSLFPDVHERLPATERLVGRVLTLPTGTSVDPEAAALIGDLVRRALAEADRLKDAMAAAGR